MGKSDYRCPSEVDYSSSVMKWKKSKDGKEILAGVYVEKLLGLADEFDESGTKNSGKATSRYRENAGEVVVEAFNHGFLHDLPNLAELVEWHTGDGSEDPKDRQAVYVRCPGNLFFELTGGGSMILRVNGTLEPNLEEGILPNLSRVVFGNRVALATEGDDPETQALAWSRRNLRQASIDGEACRLLARLIGVTAAAFTADLDGPYGNCQWRHNGEVVKDTMQVGAWKMVKHLWEQDDHTACFDELIVPVYNDTEHIADENAFGSLRKAANKFFSVNAIPLSVSLNKATVSITAK